MGLVYFLLDFFEYFLESSLNFQLQFWNFYIDLNSVIFPEILINPHLYATDTILMTY